MRIDPFEVPHTSARIRSFVRSCRSPGWMDRSTLCQSVSLSALPLSGWPLSLIYFLRLLFSLCLDSAAPAARIRTAVPARRQADAVYMWIGKPASLLWLAVGGGVAWAFLFSRLLYSVSSYSHARFAGSNTKTRCVRSHMVTADEAKKLTVPKLKAELEKRGVDIAAAGVPFRVPENSIVFLQVNYF